MTIDIVYLVILLIAVVKGLQRGLIVAVLSVIALFVGLAAAIKLSAVTASYLHDSLHLAVKWLPVLAFVLVFVAIVLLIRWAASAMRSVGQAVMIGWADRICGVILYVTLYTSIYSVILFYANACSLLSAESVADSKTYPVLKSWAPTLVNGLGAIIPLFRDMFTQLEQFFEHIATLIKKN